MRPVVCALFPVFIYIPLIVDLNNDVPTGSSMFFLAPPTLVVFVAFRTFDVIEPTSGSFHLMYQIVELLPFLGFSYLWWI